MKLDTPQTLDPLGGLTARMVVIVTIVLTLGFAAFSTLNAWSEVVSPVLAFSSIAALVAASAVLLRASDPFRAPFGIRSHLAIVALLATSAITEAGASYGSSTLILDGYSYMTAAIYLFPLGSYRPAIGVLVTGIGLAALFAVLALVQAPFLVAPFVPAVFVIITAAPCLATGAGAAVLSRHLVRSLREWQAEGMAADRGRSDTRMQPLDMLDDEVLPLLERVTSARSVTIRDADEARGVGSALRQILVAESDATVLPEWRGSIDDPRGNLASWSMRQRAGVHALAEKMMATDPAPQISLVVGERPDTWTFTATWPHSVAPARSELAAFIATLGVAFDGVRFTRTPSSVSVCGLGA